MRKEQLGQDIPSISPLSPSSQSLDTHLGEFVLGGLGVRGWKRRVVGWACPRRY